MLLHMFATRLLPKFESRNTSPKPSGTATITAQSACRSRYRDSYDGGRHRDRVSIGPSRFVNWEERSNRAISEAPAITLNSTRQNKQKRNQLVHSCPGYGTLQAF